LPATNTTVQLLTLYTGFELHNAWRHRQSEACFIRLRMWEYNNNRIRRQS